VKKTVYEIIVNTMLFVGCVSNTSISITVTEQQKYVDHDG